MPTIFLRKEFAVEAWVHAVRKQSLSFSVSFEGHEVRIVPTSDGTFFATWQCVVSEEFFQQLKTGDTEYHNLNEVNQEECLRVSNIGRHAITKVGRGVEYYLGFRPQRNSKRPRMLEEWSEDGGSWNRYPWGLTGRIGPGRLVPPVDELTTASLQAYLDSDIPILYVALRDCLIMIISRQKSY